MWALKNRTPYAAERNWIRDKDGLHLWIVAVRATFDIAPEGRLTLADRQLPPTLAPEYYGKPGESSLRYDSDLLLVKPRTDVLVLGQAYAPCTRLAHSGSSAQIVPVLLRTGPIEKQLLVYGERIYYNGLMGMKTTAPQPFTRRPIQYELAYGGSALLDPDPRQHRRDERNPIGRGFAIRTAHLIDQLAPAIEYPTGDPAKRGPAGFGPVDASWLPRRLLAGTYDERWAKSKQPLLPDDYQPDYALSAPLDQRSSQPLVGGERVELLNMTAEGRLAFDLPHITLEFTTRFGRQQQQEHAQLLTTVLIETEERRLSLVWQSTLRVAAPDIDYLDQTEIVERRSAA